MPLLPPPPPTHSHASHRGRGVCWLVELASLSHIHHTVHATSDSATSRQKTRCIAWQCWAGTLHPRHATSVPVRRRQFRRRVEWMGGWWRKGKRGAARSAQCDAKQAPHHLHICTRCSCRHNERLLFSESNPHETRAHQESHRHPQQKRNAPAINTSESNIQEKCKQICNKMRNDDIETPTKNDKAG